MAVRPIPEGYNTVTPYIVAQGTAKLIDFIKEAFGAEELARMAMPDGTVMHAELRIGDSILMFGEAQGPWKPVPALLYLYVKDADATYAQALRAGAVSMSAVADQFYGDRNGTVKDAWDNTWTIGTHIEDVAPAEMSRRAQEAAQKRG